MTMIVRPACVTDAAGIAAIHVASWRQAYCGLIPQDYLDFLSVQDRTQTWEKNLSQPPASGVATLVAELDRRIIGFASIGPSRDDDADPLTQELWGIYLHPDHWGAGHGHTLHAQALTALSSTGAKRATLWTLSGNKRARRFYEQHDWIADGAEKTDWRGDVRLDEVRYRCTLAAQTMPEIPRT
jgi:RimJ/RimL family protein N-acetyltransferase